MGTTDLLLFYNLIYHLSLDLDPYGRLPLLLLPPGTPEREVITYPGYFQLPRGKRFSIFQIIYIYHWT